MINLKISSELKEALGEKMVIGCIQAEVTVRENVETLWEEIDRACEDIAKDNNLQDVLSIRNIKISREVYKKLGKDPSRYRVSSESLARRIVKGKGLYRVNNVVDINNLISIISFWSVCTYDCEAIGNDVLLRIGKEGERYEGIGRGDINIACIPVFQDETGNFGSTTSDSVRAMVTEKTKSIFMNIVSFDGEENMDAYLKYSEELLAKYADAKNIEKIIIRV